MALAGSPWQGGDRPLLVWAVSDGRTGIENQALGLADALARITPAEVVRRHVRFRSLFDRWPTALRLAPNAMLADGLPRIEPPWPDVWIATGRASLPFSLRMKRWSGGRTLIVQTQDPRAPLGRFDLVVAPEHDDLSGPNVLSITGSPNRITPERLKAEGTHWAERLDALPGPRIACLIGGRSKSHDLSELRARALSAEIAEAVSSSGGSLMLTFSRRTPDEARAIITEALPPLPGLIWDGTGENPYFAFLGRADHILVTEDSANMAAEAASTGAPVHILRLERRTRADKFAHLHADLERRGIARPLTLPLAHWTYEPLHETDRAAREVLRLLHARAR